MASSRPDQTASTLPVQSVAPMTQTVPPTPVTSGFRQQDDEDIPTLDHIMPAIFVPLKQDLLAPIEPPKDRIERLKQTRASLDANEHAVRANMAWMFEREARRRLIEAKKTRSLEPSPEPTEMSWTEGKLLVKSVLEPYNPSETYHLSKTQLREFKAMPVNDKLETLTPHELTVREILTVAHNGSLDMEKYSTDHIAPIRERLETSLQREKKRNEEFDKPMS